MATAWFQFHREKGVPRRDAVVAWNVTAHWEARQAAQRSLFYGMTRAYNDSHTTLYLFQLISHQSPYNIYYHCRT